jgi:hypothetical protein
MGRALGLMTRLLFPGIARRVPGFRRLSSPHLHSTPRSTEPHLMVNKAESEIESIDDNFANTTGRDWQVLNLGKNKKKLIFLVEPVRSLQAARTRSNAKT